MPDALLTLVLMAGLPGAGKSTLARELGNNLGWHVISKDDYMAELSQQGLSDEMAGFAAYDISFNAAREVLTRQQSSVILDTAALHAFVLDHAKEIVSNATNARLKVILCVADRDLRNRRLRKRPAQITAIRVDPATIADYLQQFKHLPSDMLTLYTNHPLEKCLSEAKEYLMS